MKSVSDYETLLQMIIAFLRKLKDVRKILIGRFFMEQRLMSSEFHFRVPDLPAFNLFDNFSLQPITHTDRQTFPLLVSFVLSCDISLCLCVSTGGIECAEEETSGLLPSPTLRDRGVSTGPQRPRDHAAGLQRALQVD